MEHVVHDWLILIVQVTVVLRKIVEPEFDWIVAYSAQEAVRSLVIYKS